MAKIVFRDLAGEERSYYSHFDTLPRMGETLTIKHYDKVYNLTVTDIIHVLKQAREHCMDLLPAKSWSDKSGIVVNCRCYSLDEVEPELPYGDF